MNSSLGNLAMLGFAAVAVMMAIPLVSCLHRLGVRPLAALSALISRRRLSKCVVPAVCFCSLVQYASTKPAPDPETVSSAESSATFLDTRAGKGPLAAKESEQIAWSGLWSGDEGSTVTVAQNGAALAEGLSGEGELAWSADTNGTYVLTHTTYSQGVEVAVETATFVVSGKDEPPEGPVVVSSADSQASFIDTRAGKGEPLAAKESEQIAWSGLWSSDADAAVSVSLNGSPFASGTGEGVATWTPSAAGVYEFRHETEGSDEVLTATFEVATKDMSLAVVGIDCSTVVYTGGEHRPAVLSATWDGAALAEGVDYALSYSGNVDAGTATVTLAGIGFFGGSYVTNFTILKRDVTLTSGSASKEYDGTALVMHDVAVGGDGFAEGEGAVAEYTGSQTCAGSSENAFTYELAENTKADNYAIATFCGTLTVTRAENAWIRTPYVSGWTYGQSPSEPDMGEAKFGSATVVYGEMGASRPTSPGDYVATFTVEGTDDYSGLSSSVPFTIFDSPRPYIPGDGTVTPPKSWKTGQKVTWKAAAAKGSVFAHWEGELVESLGLSRNELRNPSLQFVVPSGFDADQISAVFISIDDDGLRELSFRDGNGQEMGDEEGILLELGKPVEFWLVDDSKSYVKATVSGLPAGLKFDAKTMKVSGTPKKSGACWVQVKAKNASGYQWAEKVRMVVPGYTTEPREPKLTRTAYHPLTVISSDEAAGTVSGTGVYAEGKKASISAKPAKGRVFAGWYCDAALTKPMVFASGDYRKASQSVVIPEARYLFARFVEATSADDPVTGFAAKGSGLVGENAFAWRVGVAVSDGDGVEYESASLPSASAAKLPPGVKFDAAKGLFTGVPTKAGSYTATVTVKNASKATAAVTLAIVVNALDDWAQGTFNGRVSSAVGGTSEEEVAGLVTLTVSATGKIGGKVLEGGKTWSLSAPSFGSVEEGLGGLAANRVYHATVVSKSGKDVATNEIAVVSGSVEALGLAHSRGVATGELPGIGPKGSKTSFSAWQNLWKGEPWKTTAKSFAKAPTVTTPDKVSLVFSSSGAVTAKFLSYSCSSVLIPCGGGVFSTVVYFPPKSGKFDGHAAEILLEWNGKSFAIAE